MKLFIILLWTLSALPAARAQTDADEVIQQFEQKIKQRQKQEQLERLRERNRGPIEKALNRTHKSISKSIFSVSDNIDEFFAGEQFQEEKNGSLIRFSYENLMVESEEPRHDLSLNARLVLPRTQERLNFLLQSLDDENPDEEQEPLAQQNFNTIEQEKKQNLFAGLRFRNIQTKEWSINTDAGVKIVWPPDPFARLRLRRSFFISKWELRLTENVYWYESDGWSQVASLDLERPIPSKNLLKFGNRGTRRDDEGYWRFAHSIGWYHRASEAQAFSYAVGVTAEEEPAYALQTYFVGMAFRQRLVDDWMYLNIVPNGVSP